MMSSCLFGQTGPLRRYAGFGTMGASLAGFFHLTGWPDRPPCGPFGAYSDYMSPRFALCALLAALDHRDRTGEGQYLDFAQAEAGAHFLTPALLDFAVNGHGGRATATSTRSWRPTASTRPPATTSGSPWPAATTPTGGRSPSWSVAATWRRWAPRSARRRAELDTLVAAWTAPRSPDEAPPALIAAGVPAHVVQNSSECAVDPQLPHHGHFVALPHAEHGTVVVEGTRMALTATPAVVGGVPPLLGQDTVDVLTEVLGYDDERLGVLFAAGALE